MKAYIKVISGMEMKMARGRFLGVVVECVSVSFRGFRGWGLEVRGELGR